MTSKRFRRGNFTSFTFPAPVSLINKSETAINMSVNYAQHLENLLPQKRGVLSKRHGFTNLGMTGIPTTEKIIAGHSISLSDGTFKFLVFTDVGSAYHSNSALTTWTNLTTGLNTTGTYRFTDFNQKVIVVNGKDPNKVYDGTTLTDLAEFVQDNLATSLTKVDADTLTLQPGLGRTDTDYPAGRNIKIQMDSSGVDVDAVVLSTSYVSGTNTLTINLTTGIITGTVIDVIKYEDSPPPFSFIYAAHDRLWALSGGELKAKEFRTDSFEQLISFLHGQHQQ